MNTPESESSRPQPSGLQLELGAKKTRNLIRIWLPLLLFLVVGSVTLLAWLPKSSPTLSPVPNATLQNSRPTQPKITWSQTQLELILSPGETATRDFTFTSDKSLQKIIIEPVPELSPFISIQPNGFANVPAGQPQSVRVIFSIPANATLGTYDGTIHVRLASQTLPQTLKVLVRAWPSFGDSGLGFRFNYPPDWLIEQHSTSVRVQNYRPADDQTGNGLAIGRIFVEVFSMPVAMNPNLPERITNSETVTVGGRNALRGFRSTAEVSPLPGYDMYVMAEDRIFVLAGSYDGTSSSSVEVIRTIQDSFLLQ